MTTVPRAPHRRVLLVSTPIGTLGSGRGGGVELTLGNVARALARRGHHIDVLAPAGSYLDGQHVIEVPGVAPPSAQHEARDAPTVLPPDSLVANLFAAARALQDDYDVLVSFAYDWLGLYLTPFFTTPLAHVVGMGSLLDVVDEAAAAVVAAFPGRIAVHTRSQAATYAFADGLHVLGSGFDLDGYDFVGRVAADAPLAWVGRISPEKGLGDAVAAASACGRALEVFGVVEDEVHWDEVRRRARPGVIVPRGFLATAELQAALGRCRALLVTPKWEEAFGNVVVEALACGVPVVTYDRGGPAELVEHGVTGWVVAPDSVDALVAAVGRVDEIDRATCRARAEARFSLDALGEGLERWLEPVIEG